MKAAKFLKLTTNMVLLVALIAAGCSNNVTGPNNQNGQVSFQVSQQPGNNGGTVFLFNPSVDVKVSRIVSIYQGENFTDTITYTNTNYTYSKDSLYMINEYTGVVNGQQWKFDFKGTAGNSNYNVTANYTVQ